MRTKFRTQGSGYHDTAATQLCPAAQVIICLRRFSSAIHQHTSFLSYTFHHLDILHTLPRLPTIPLKHPPISLQLRHRPMQATLQRRSHFLHNVCITISLHRHSAPLNDLSLDSELTALLPRPTSHTPLIHGDHRLLLLLLFLFWIRWLLHRPAQRGGRAGHLVVPLGVALYEVGGWAYGAVWRDVHMWRFGGRGAGGRARATWGVGRWVGSAACGGCGVEERSAGRRMGWWSAGGTAGGRVH